MPGCAAFGCTNRSEKGMKMYLFPADKQRRQQWTINVRRKEWQPSKNSFLCEAHFEHSQFEAHRADGWRKLKPTAVPTLFDVPNPPRKFNPSLRKSVYKRRATSENTSQGTGQIRLRIDFEKGRLSAMMQKSSAPVALAMSTSGNAIVAPRY